MNEFDKLKKLRSDQIDVVQLATEAFKQKKIILRFLISFAFIGVFVAFFSEKLYTAKTVLLPQTVEHKMGGLGGLASIAGINLGAGGGGDDVIPPKLYPKIISSYPFKKELLNATLTYANGKKITFKDFYLNYYSPSVLFTIKKYTIGLPRLIISLLKGEKKKGVTKNTSQQGIYSITKEDESLFNIIDNQLSVKVNNKEGFIVVSYSMPNALYAAEMLKQAQKLLQERVIDFKIKKLKSDLIFIEKGYNEAKAKFLKKQASLAYFQDKNQGFVYSRSKSKLESLMAEYRLANNIYQEFAKQLESQKIKLNENTPVFSVIDPVCIPLRSSSPKKSLVILIWSLFGAILGLGVVLFKLFKELNPIQSIIK